MGKPKFSIGTIAPTKGLVDEYFNDSTDGATGDGDLAETIVSTAKLKVVNSPLFDGDGLNVKPDSPVPNSETTSEADSTPVGAGRQPVRSEIHKVKTGTRK